MLREIILASVPRRQNDRPYTGLSCSGLFPCPYRMYKVHRGEVWNEPDEVQILNMEDGWNQEDQAVWRLERAGVPVKGRGKEERYLKVGRTGIPGSWDGCVDLDTRRTWEHKAMDYDWFWLLKSKGVEAFPGYRAQVNAYTLGKSLKGWVLQAKCKGNNDIYDIVGDLDLDFITPIIEWGDRIREGWVPEPEKCEYCSKCGIHCFGETYDMSGITSASLPEVAEKWRRGKQLQLVGSMLEDEARLVLIGKKDKEGKIVERGLIGDQDVLLVSGLKVQKIPSRRFEISKELLVQEYGPLALAKVGIEKDITTFRITDLEGKEE